MPITPTYPGVYIEELPSGVRTITGVATSITAFIGRARKGPVNDPTSINSFADYERTFGGLWRESTMSYAVRDFYLNRGGRAVIVRITRGALKPARISLPTEPSSPPSTDLYLDALSPGTWGGNLGASVDYNTADPTAAPTSPPTPPDSELFNLVIYEKNDEGVYVKMESHFRVSLDNTETRYLPRVLEQSSAIVRVPKDSNDKWIIPTSRPLETDVPTSPPSASVPVSASSGTDGDDLNDGDFTGSALKKTGLHALEKADLFNLLCIPPATREGNTSVTIWQEAMKYCAEQRAMLIVDPPASWGASPATAKANALSGLSTLGLSGPAARNAALYFPRVREADPLRKGQIDTFVPCGIIAGIMARTDTQRGVWKAPAGLDAALNNIRGLQVTLTDDENGELNPLGINCLRTFPVNGTVVWGARTLRGADQTGDEYKYVPVRRTALFIEESLYRGTQWVVFEPNDEPLWAQIRLNITAFMHDLFRQGAFQGTTPKDAYLVKCDKETTTQSDINKGIVNILVGFAPLKPAEFVIIKIQQLAGQLDV